jgi:hypothetical protein
VCGVEMGLCCEQSKNVGPVYSSTWQQGSARPEKKMPVKAFGGQSTGWLGSQVVVGQCCGVPVSGSSRGAGSCRAAQRALRPSLGTHGPAREGGS